MHVECFSTGRVRSKRRERGLRRYLPGGWSDTTLPVNASVLEHTLGLCVFDTGQTGSCQPTGLPPALAPLPVALALRARARRRAAATAPSARPRPQRRALGRPLAPPYRPRWHGRIVSGGRGDRLENGVAAGPGAAGDGCAATSRTAGQPGSRAHLVEVDGPAIGPFAGSFDIAGDGSLLLVPTPAHTPGHLSMLADAHDGLRAPRRRPGHCARSWRGRLRTSPHGARRRECECSSRTKWSENPAKIRADALRSRRPRLGRPRLPRARAPIRARSRARRRS